MAARQGGMDRGVAVHDHERSAAFRLLMVLMVGIGMQGIQSNMFTYP